MTQTPVPPATSGDDDLDLVALTPAHLEATQAHLVAVCEHRTRQLEVEMKDLEEHLLLATANGWKLRGLSASIGRVQKRIEYYAKVKVAVQEGYVIVPNFPISILACRTNRAIPKWTTSEYDSSSAFTVTPQMLPAGEGRYVDERMVTQDESWIDEDKKRHSQWRATDYDAPDFPYALVKPVVIEATERAMKLRVFDAIGMVENRSGRDPIMVGQILDPRRNGRHTTWFIAWWLNTRAL